MMVKLSNQAISINVPRSQVFQKFSSVADGKPSDETGEGTAVVERDGNRLLVEFVDRSPGTLNAPSFTAKVFQPFYCNPSRMARMFTSGVSGV